jgi:hypothetical protein
MRAAPAAAVPGSSRSRIRRALWALVLGLVLVLGSSPPAHADCGLDRQLQVGGGQLELRFDAAAFSSSPTELCHWTEQAARAVADYFGRFPVSQVHIVLRPVEGERVLTGTTYPDGGDGVPLITVQLGRRTRVPALQGDWVMAHEMVHLAVPSVPRNSHWLEEGIATYVEPVARIQLGQISAQKFWGDLLLGIPKGMPQSGDRGLDRTPTWGRTYWGGALFCLLADIEIRQRSQGHKTLRDALRGLVATGESIRDDRTVEEVLSAADQATGLNVMTELYRRMAARPAPESIDWLWRRLGVSLRQGQVVFDDTAEWAALRKAMTQKP